MNIPMISSLRFSSPVQQNNSQNKTSSYGLVMAKPLLKDTVSFKAKIKDIMVDKYIHQEQYYRGLGDAFINAIEVVAQRLKEKGVVFDRPFYQDNVIKSAKSYISKILRSKDLDVRDKIRTTLYAKDSHDLSFVFKELLPTLEDVGYVVKEDFLPLDTYIKRGYIPTAEEIKKGKVKMPDLDIRLNGIESQISKLPEEYRYCVASAQKSGYEDIQMRLVRKFEANRKDAIKHELLILFGKNYAEVKKIESEKIYDIIRRFDETNIVTKEDAVVLNRSIELIKKAMRREFSSKLFDSAKNKDMGIPIDVRISFTPEDQLEFDNSFEILNKSLSEYYRDAKKLARHPNTKEKLNKELLQDRTIIKKIQEDLQKSIDYFKSYDTNPALS